MTGPTWGDDPALLREPPARPPARHARRAVTVIHTGSGAQIIARVVRYHDYRRARPASGGASDWLGPLFVILVILIGGAILL